MFDEEDDSSVDTYLDLKIIDSDTIYSPNFEDEHTYEGEIHPDENLYHGHGTLEITNSNIKYIGEFVFGKFNGKGQLFFSNGDYYNGEFLDNLYHGSGVYKSVDGENYEGDYKFGEQCGYGKLEVKNGGKYVGQMAHNDFHGVGIITFPNGDSYEGDFKRGKKHGSGVLKYLNKDILSIKSNFWNYDSISGLAIIKFKDKSKMIGNFYSRMNENRYYHLNNRYYNKKQILRGYGRPTIFITNSNNPNNITAKVYANGFLKYKGQVKDYEYNGKGILYSSSSRILYEGEFLNGSYNGEGTFYGEDFTYKGKFKLGKFHGKFLVENKINNTKESIYYINGKEFFKLIQYSINNLDNKDSMGLVENLEIPKDLSISQSKYNDIDTKTNNSKRSSNLEELNVNKEEKCSICLTNFEDGEELANLQCNHYFHIDCIKKWLNKNESCPLCRSSKTIGRKRKREEMLNNQ